VSVYENAFLGPEDSSSNGAILDEKAVFFIQTCGGTIWPDGNSCGHTGICSNHAFYKSMRDYKYTEDPWKSAFPELLAYDATPDSGSWYCAARRSCPMASWNNTVICNSAVGSNRVLANRAVWPSDPESSQRDDAIEGNTVPARIDALTEYGNKAGSTFTDNEQAIDLIESKGMADVLLLASRVAQAAEGCSECFERCEEGARTGAARSELAGRNNNPCSSVWALNGMASCDTCTGNEGMRHCAARYLPNNQLCGGNVTTTPVPQRKKRRRRKRRRRRRRKKPGL
jgi:hypothetical protein